jgi:hypothetical protein
MILQAIMSAAAQLLLHKDVATQEMDCSRSIQIQQKKGTNDDDIYCVLSFIP